MSYSEAAHLLELHLASIVGGEWLSECVETEGPIDRAGVNCKDIGPAVLRTRESKFEEKGRVEDLFADLLSQE